MACKECDDLYPHYGVGPHLCFHRKEGGFAANSPGQSDNTFDLDNWPKNFFVEVEPGETLEDLKRAYSTCGIWTCPKCGPFEGELYGALSKPAFMERFGLTRTDAGGE